MMLSNISLTLFQIPGVSAFHVWSTMKKAKETLVRDVAVHFLSLFNLRFSHPGSLYYAQGPSVQVGPLITVYLTDKCGSCNQSNAVPCSFKFHACHWPPIERPELHVLKHSRTGSLQSFNGDETLFNLGERTLKKAIQLVTNRSVDIGFSSGDTATRPFSINLDKFHLADIMVRLL